MYKTAGGDEVFVIDGHVHFWDGSPANQKNVHGKQFIECFYAYHSGLSPKEEVYEQEGKDAAQGRCEYTKYALRERSFHLRVGCVQ